jgi:hypothetical protein
VTADPVQPTVDPLELGQFLEDRRDVQTALTYARRFAKTDPFADRQEAGEAADAIKALNNVRRTAEKRKLEVTAEWRASTNAVNAQYKELLAPIAAAESALKAKGLAFKKAEEERLAEEQRREREELDRKAEETAADAQAAAELAAQEPANLEARQLAADAHGEAAKAAVATPLPPRDAPKNLRGGFSSLGSRTEYRHEVVDAALVPDRHKVVSEDSIKAAIKAEKVSAKATGRDFDLNLIPGIRIYPDEIAVSR